MTDRVNPIVVEIIRNAVNSAAREMNSCLIKSAFGPGTVSYTHLDVYKRQRQQCSPG